MTGLRPDYATLLVAKRKSLASEEASCDRLIDTGLFGDAAKDRPWPDHDKALVRDFKRLIERDCVTLIAFLMGWVNSTPTLSEMSPPREELTQSVPVAAKHDPMLDDFEVQCFY